MTSTIHADPAPQPSAEMLRMLNAFLTVQALHAAALLGLADLVAGGPKSVDELAAATQADRSSLHRLLRMLTAPGVFREEADGRPSRQCMVHRCGSTSPRVRTWATRSTVG